MGSGVGWLKPELDIGLPSISSSSMERRRKKFEELLGAKHIIWCKAIFKQLELALLGPLTPPCIISDPKGKADCFTTTIKA